MRKIFLTAALPYANSSLHIGHLSEHLQADMWARFQRLRGHQCWYICADDTHGTPIMLESQKRGISPEVHIGNIYKEHVQDFKDFLIDFTHYSSTHTEENRQLCEYFFSKIKEKNLLRSEKIQQLFCPKDKMFLPDRFVRGQCPQCKSANQYGDSCDKCGSTYQPKDLIEPQCAHCGTKPTLAESEHLFFTLSPLKAVIEKWLGQHTSPEVRAKMQEWLKGDLRDWDISRDAPYFGFEIPGYKNKFFYVWVDAPMGYISTLSEFLKKQGSRTVFDFLKDPDVEMIHLIGKDIMYFHTLFWPAFLHAGDLPLPKWVQAHGHLTVNGEKMSKSKGSQITARTFLTHADPEGLRYYFASKINSGLDDFDFSTQDFSLKINAELLGKFVNLGSRSLQMINQHFANKIQAPQSHQGLEVLSRIRETMKDVATHYEAWNFAKATSRLRESAESLNKYFDEQSPWKIIKTNPDQAYEALVTAAQGFRMLMIALSPITPKLGEKVRELFEEKEWTWASLESYKNGTIGVFSHLMSRVETERIEKMIVPTSSVGSTAINTGTSPSNAESKISVSSQAKSSPESSGSTIEIEEFSKIDLRIAKIVEANHVDGADKLLRLKVDLGPLGQRQIFAGIKAAYQPETLVGRLTVIVANLKPRQMKFGLSEGMVLAAGAGGKDLFILSPDSGAQPGDKVK